MSVRLAVVIAALFSVFGAFMFTAIVDESTVPGAARVAVSGEMTTTGGDGLPLLVERAAQEIGAVVVREVPDLYDPTTRHLYVVMGDESRPEGQWLTDGYPGFTDGVTTVVHAGAELEAIDPRGNYFVFGPERAARGLADVFTGLGYQAEVSERVGSLAETVHFFAAGPFNSATLVVLLLVALLTGSGVLAGTKAYAVQRLHGASKRMVMMRDLRWMALMAGITAAFVCVGSLAGLWFYNGLHQIGAFLQLAGALFLVALALEFVVYAAFLHLVWGMRLLDGIKGRLGFRVAVPVAYLVRIPGLLLSVVLAASTFAAAGGMAHAAQAREALETAGNAAKIRFEDNVSPEEMDRLAFESGAWLKQEDAAGRTILAHPVSTMTETPGAEPDLLLVNNAYLERQPVLGADGARVDGASAKKVLLLVPESASLTAESTERYIRGSAGTEGLADVFEVRTIPSGQSHFLYTSGAEVTRPAEIADVVLVVVGPGSGLIRDDDYMAYASQGSVLVTDPKEAIAHTPPGLMGAWISAYIPVVQAAAAAHAEQARYFRIQMGSLIVALGVLLATAVGLAQIHVRGSSQQILVRYLHGWRFARTHGRLLAAELILVGVVMVWAIIEAVTVIRSQADAAIDGPFLSGNDVAIATGLPWALALIAVLNLGLLCLAVQARTRSMIRTRSEETA
jgi:hypothetical protein